MRKRFFIKLIPTFHSCRPKHPPSLPTNPIPSFAASQHKHNHHIKASNPSPNHKPHRFSLRNHVSSAFSSARRGCLRSRASPEPSHNQSPPFKYHVITTNKQLPHDHHYNNYDSTPPRRKIYNSAASDTDHHENDVVFLPPPRHKLRRRRRTTTRSFHKARISTSSDSGLFSEEEEEGRLHNDNQTLVSSDSAFSPTPNRHVNKSKQKETTKKLNSGRSRSSKRRSSFDTPAVPARLSEFMRKMTPCKAVVANGKVRESFAMVKKSEEPYEDFKRSMVEMVVEKEMFEERELEELLRCFLSLNSERHHDDIVRAFTHVWKALFCRHSSSSSKE